MKKLAFAISVGLFALCGPLFAQTDTPPAAKPKSASAQKSTASTKSGASATPQKPSITLCCGPRF